MYFKLLHGYVDLQFTDFLTINNNRTTRKNLFALTSSWKTNFESNLFSNRAINVWNSLSNDIVLSQSVNQLKCQIRSVSLSNCCKRNFDIPVSS